MNDCARRVSLRVVFLLAASLMGTLAFAQEKASKPAKPAKAPKEQPAPAAPAQPDYGAALKNLQWREIGPAIMGGRIDDFAVVESDPSIAYVGAASGGIWKTTNGGTTWEPVFDNETSSSIGDLAIAPTDPSIVWAGTGEPNNRQSSSWGVGIYKSADTGKTWTNMGLAESHHIGRVVIHPTNPDEVYVAALGHLWGPNKERGVYKTTDGGKTWTQSLFVNEDTGVVDIAIDPQSPDTLYAAAYQRRRTAFGFNGGGPSGGIYKTTDGGATWKKLTKGLPYAEGGDVGRIGLAIYRRNPNIVYAVVQHAKGGAFRSEDRGETWTKMGDTNPRPSYYSEIVVDPNNDLRIWELGAPIYFSEDGGKTFVQTRGSRIHGDYHTLWINPRNSNHMIAGTDGGIHWTYDGGRNWDYGNTLALGQFYEIGVDMRKPYFICGGLQDNGSWCGPSATLFTQGITNDDWFRVGGGDGFYVQVDPTDPAIVYIESQDGNVNRRDLRTNEARSIRPQPKEGEPQYRFQWNSPIVISAHDAKTIYYGGNFLFKSANRGDTWTKLGGDLTTGADRNKMPILGRMSDKDMLSRHDGVQQWPCITTISESPLTSSVLWAGTDDGNLQVTRDAGKTWKNVAEKVPGVPKGTYVSRVVASKFAEGTAYVTFDGHRSNDFNIYVFTTADYGETWKAISNGIKTEDGTLNVIREHPRNQNVLFAGAERGVFASFDRGEHWTSIKMNLPTVPVDDIAIHPRDNDIILGTHGRSIWVLDDATPVEQLDSKTLDSNLRLFDIRPATAWRMYGNKGNTGAKFFIARNPTYGALINFYLKSKPAENDRLRITITDKDGNTVGEITCGARPAGAPAAAGPGGGGGEGGEFGFAAAVLPCEPKPGINRVNWDLRRRLPPQVLQQLQQAAGGGGGGGGGGFRALARGPMAEPGDYTVKISLGQTEITKTVKVEEDPRIMISAEERAVRRQAIDRLFQMSIQVLGGQRTVTTLRTSLHNALEGWKRPGAVKVPDNIQKAAEDLEKKVTDLCGKFATVVQCGGQGEGLGNAGPPLEYRPPPFTQRVGRLMDSIEGYTAAPTAGETEQLEVVAKLMTDALAQLRKLEEEDLASLNKMMNEAGIPHIAPANPPGGAGRGRR